MQNNVSVYPFNLEFDRTAGAARFPFIFKGSPVTGLSCALSARSAGNMGFSPRPGLPPHSNPKREAFFHSQGIDPERVYSLFQVHSRNVYSVGDPSSAGEHGLPSPTAFARQGDGMVSFCHDVFLALTVADCLPVFLLDTENLFFAALHSGWRGTGIVLKALSVMTQAGTRPEMVAAVLGPCIQGCCYRVDEQRARDFEKEFGGAGPLGNAVLRRDDGPYISLQAANARLLAGAGLRHIAVCENCTYTDERLGSFRREGPEQYTRMAAVAGPFVTP
ncbi:MAG: polyphenol oxidase family protein [Treponema sp.]|jgi:YfiH family protein|nr:polyphenol oxidase family protein [Treponema sp.]